MITTPTTVEPLDILIYSARPYYCFIHIVVIQNDFIIFISFLQLLSIRPLYAFVEIYEYQDWLCNFVHLPITEVKSKYCTNIGSYRTDVNN